MSATNRTIEAEVITLGDDAASRAKLAFEAEKIAAESGCDLAAVLAVLGAVRERKRKGKRAKCDFYETPGWVIDAIAAALPLSGEPVVLDAGAGTGAIAAKIAELNPKAEIIGLEKNSELVAKARERHLFSAEFLEADFLKWSPELGTPAPDIVIMNPPFSYALPFVLKALAVVKRGGTVCALLRQAFAAGKSRREFHKKHPSDMHVLTKRPSFTGGGKTDATEYAWFIWSPTGGGHWFPLTHDDKSKRRPRAARKKIDATPAEA